MSNDLINISSGMSIKDIARKERLDALAICISPLPWFNIDLLHKLYINIFEKHFSKDEDGQHSFETRSITCADLIGSSDIIRIDYNAFELEKNKRELLRNEINKERKVLLEIGQFMVAYAQSNHHHFLSPRYREVLNIEGQIIIDPSSAAGEITTHISNQLNQHTDTNKTIEIAEYYLNVINKNSRNPGIKELKKYLEGKKEWAEGNTEKALQKFKGLKDGSNSKSKTITVQLPQSIQNEIKANFEKLNKQAVIDKVGRGICLVHVNKSNLGNGILLTGGYLLTANHLIKSVEDAELTTIRFKKQDVTNSVEYNLDPVVFFITMFHDDLDFTIVKIEDLPSSILEGNLILTLTEDELIPKKVIAMQITPEEKFKSGEGSILDASDTRIYHDILLDRGGSGSPVFDNDGQILGMTVASNRSKGGSRVEAIRIDRIKAELSGLGMDINNLDALVKSSNLHCILVGNNQYHTSNIYPLRGAINDATRMRHFIHSNLSWSTLKFIENGSKQDIIQAFEGVKNELKDGDTLLFYYAGYGGKEVGYFEKQTKFIVTSDRLPDQKETNRLSHFELQYLYQQCFEKDIQLVSILDCGYHTNSSRETSETTYYRSLPEVLNRRREQSMIYGEKFQPGEVLNNNLVSIVVADENEDVLERVTGGRFMDQFLKIQSGRNVDMAITEKTNLSFEMQRGKIKLHQLERDFNDHDVENINAQQTIEIFSYPDDNKEVVLFEQQFLFGDQLVERRLANAMDKDELDLSGINLKTVPDNIFELKKLRNIDLSHNEIEYGFSKLMARDDEEIRWDRAFDRLDRIRILNVEHNPIEDTAELALLVMICKDVKYSKERLDENKLSFLNDLKTVVPTIFKLAKTGNVEGVTELLQTIFQHSNPNEIPDEIIKLSKGKILTLQELIFVLSFSYGFYAEVGENQRAEIVDQILNLDPDSEKEKAEKQYSNAENINEQQAFSRVNILLLNTYDDESSLLELSSVINKIRDTLNSAKHRDRFNFTTNSVSNLKSISQIILRDPWNIIHLVQPEVKDNQIRQEENVSNTFLTSNLVRMLQSMTEPVNCVILQPDTDASSQEISAIGNDGIFVVNIPPEIDERFASGFATSFYESLGEELDYEQAFSRANIQTSMESRSTFNAELWFNGERIDSNLMA